MSWQLTLDLFAVLFSTSKESLAHWTLKALTRLDEVFPDDDHKNRSAWRTYLPHARYILESDLINNEHPQREGLLWKYSQCLYSDGRYTEAEGPISEVTDEKEGAGSRASRHADQHGQPRGDVLESRAMEGGRRAVCASDGDEFEGAGRGASLDADQHGQPRGDVPESRAMEGGRRAVCASDGNEFEGAGRGASQHADQHEQPGVYPEVLKTRY
jgi:hypothetical protein